MIGILGVVATFGLAIFIHELGHFIAAKVNRFKVEVFSIGFGKRLFGLKRRETDYRISMIPFGGYVKMAGEEPRPDLPVETHEFLSKPWWRRMGVYLSGPLFNILLSAPIFILVFMLGAPTLMSLNVVGEVEEGLLGERAGVMVGDTILEVNHHPVQDWHDLVDRVTSHPSNLLTLKIERDGVQKLLTITSDEKITQERLGLYPIIPAEVGSLREGYPAEEAGLKVGDLIISLNGIPIHQWSQMTEIIHSTLDGEILVGVRRGAEEFVVSITPVVETIPLVNGGQKRVGLIGIGPKVVFRRLSPLHAISKGCRWVFYSVGMAYDSLLRLLTGKASLRQIVGPIGIARMAGERVHEGLGSLLWFIAFLSVNLGVLNLLPIPVLDGGHILFCLIEGVRGRMVSLRVQEMAIRVGVALIFTLIIFVTINDLARTRSFKRITEIMGGLVERLPWIEGRQGPSR